ncbi:hypothetical protein LTS08_007171 [Lithohypha guttulata]|uniref:NAD(P)-binding protein n=1 Tax=Lithohypha guttulata TaxID=1690604 RepID=A0AAN7Y722_9EURO|nr:hypothetical protein LTR05_003926 [Lithohypha guttulata]KAK5097150.1 hypothetical protein LTS08_007171 [Lithohypha guttulata]
MDITKPIDNLFSAKDLVVVITGGGSGIGLAFASALAKGNASKVFLLGRRLPVLEEAANSIDPNIVQAVQCDVTDPSSISAAVSQIEKQTSYVDVLINNAGIEGPDHKQIKAANTIAELQAEMLKEWDLWTPTWQTNTAAVIAVTGAFLHLLDAGNKRRGWVENKREVQQRVDGYTGDLSDTRTSQIITVTSISSFNREITASLAYTASKAGATVLGKSLANLLAPFGIRSNIIAPGRFPSAMTAGAETVYPVNKVPAGVPGQFEDMAGVVLYLVSRAGAYVNGNVQVCDGGRLSVMPAMY